MKIISVSDFYDSEEVIMAPKIDWSLKKTIIKKDLDLSVHKGPLFDSWKRQVEGLFSRGTQEYEKFLNPKATPGNFGPLP